MTDRENEVRKLVERYEKRIVELEAELEEARKTFEVIDWWTDENGDRHVTTTNGEDFCHYVKGEHAEMINEMLCERDERIAELERLWHAFENEVAAQSVEIADRDKRIAELEDKLSESRAE